MGITRWASPYMSRTAENAAVVALYLLMMLALLGLPASMFLAVTRNNGANVGGNLILSSLGQWLLYGVFLFIFALSIVTGGFARVFLRPRHLDWPWLIVLGLGLLLGLTRIGDEAREAVGQLRPVAGSNNSDVIAFFAFWLLMIGYAGKAVWDEARDRIAVFFEVKIATETALMKGRAEGLQAHSDKVR